MPANLLFQSQFAARPSRRHHQPTATHRPPCTREYPPPQSLVNSRHHSSNAHASAPVPTSPLPSRKSPIILQILLQTIPPTLVKLSSSLVKRSHERPCASGAPPIPKIPNNPANPASDNPPKSHVNSRHLSSNTHTSAPAPASPLPSRKSPKILQIQLQTIRPTEITAHPQYPMTSYMRCYYPLSAIHYPLSTIHYPLSAIHYPLSTIHYPLVSTKNLPTARSGAFVL